MKSSCVCFGKLYDAVAVTKLVASGRLSLDKTLAEYLPGRDDRMIGKGVTDSDGRYADFTGGVDLEAGQD